MKISTILYYLFYITGFIIVLTIVLFNPITLLIDSITIIGVFLLVLLFIIMFERNRKINKEVNKYEN